MSLKAEFQDVGDELFSEFEEFIVTLLVTNVTGSTYDPDLRTATEQTESINLDVVLMPFGAHASDDLLIKQGFTGDYSALYLNHNSDAVISKTSEVSNGSRNFEIVGIVPDGVDVTTKLILKAL